MCLAVGNHMVQDSKESKDREGSKGYEMDQEVKAKVIIIFVESVHSLGVEAISFN